ncbi:MAG: TetR/AcrR family transcriptional regulator, partial [Sphingomonadales bacterium]
MTREKPILGRREARRIDRREAIIAVAYSSFLDHGYAATTMSGIAATIGGSKATLWSYFPSKEALFEAVLDNATETYRTQLSTLLDTSVDSARTLRIFCGNFLEKITTPEALALQRLVHAEAGRFPEVGRIFYERGPRTTQTLVAAFLGAAMERGQLRRDDPLRAARTLSSLCMSGIHQQLI